MTIKGAAARWTGRRPFLGRTVLTTGGLLTGARRPPLGRRPPAAPPRPSRIVVVRTDAADVFPLLDERYAGDRKTCVVWDRRSGADRRTRVAAVEVERREGQRRFPDHRDVLVARGFFVARMLGSARRAGMSG